MVPRRPVPTLSKALGVKTNATSEEQEMAEYTSSLRVCAVECLIEEVE